MICFDGVLRNDHILIKFDVGPDWNFPHWFPINTEFQLISLVSAFLEVTSFFEDSVTDFPAWKKYITGFRKNPRFDIHSGIGFLDMIQNGLIDILARNLECCSLNACVLAGRKDNLCCVDFCRSDPGKHDRTGNAQVPSGERGSTYFDPLQSFDQVRIRSFESGNITQAIGLFFNHRRFGKKNPYHLIFLQAVVLDSKNF